MAFGDNLKRLRQEHNLTQEELAEKVGISKSSVSYYEHSKKTPAPSLVAQFSEIFNVSMDVLMGVDKPLRDQSIDVSGLTPKEIKALENLVDIMRNRRD